jgi:phage shock protein PspC (stress-responsive transcriptional regulator)
MVLRLLIMLIVGAGALYVVAYVVADLMEPPKKEIVRPVATDKLGR